MQWFKPRKKNKNSVNWFKKKSAGEIYEEEEFRHIIDRERARADRTDHRFSLIVIDLGFNNGNHHSNGLQLKKIISRMRRIDEIGWYDPRRIGIILPYTSEQGAYKFAESLCEFMDPSMTECIFNVYTYDFGNNSAAEPNYEKIGKGV